VGVWGYGSSADQDWSPGLLDRAETFEETGVSVSGGGVTNNNGTVEMAPWSDGVTYYNSDDSTRNTTTWCGYFVTPKQTGDADIRVNVSNNPDDGVMSEMKVVDTSDGTVVQRDTGLSVGDGSSYTMTGVPVTSGNEYRVAGQFDHLAYATSVDPTRSTSTYDVNAASMYDGSRYSSRTHLINELSLTITTDKEPALVEYPAHEDVAEWDSVYYQISENGGAYSVYAVDPSTGDRLTGHLEDPGDISGLNKTVNVAFEVVLERASDGTSPGLEAIFRRRKIT